MRVSSVFAPLAFAAGVSAWANSSTPISYVTDVVTEYTTYCPGPTSIVEGGVTYTVTEATTLTITDCPCTRVTPVYTSSVSVCTECVPVPTTTVSASPVAPTGNVSTPVAPVSPTFTGGAANLAVSGGALAGLLAVAALLL